MLCIAVASKEAKIVSELKFLTECDIRMVVVDRKALLHSIQLAYRGSIKLLEEAIDAASRDGVTEPIRNQEKKVDVRGAANPESQLLLTLIDHAIGLQASDIHITPRECGCYVRLRLKNGQLTEESRVSSREVQRRMVQRIKVLSRLDISKHDIPQDGGFDVPLIEGKARGRVSIMPTNEGERIVIRILGEEGIRKFHELRYSERSLALIKNGLDESAGMMIFSGATGSGKTTSLYGAMEYLHGMGLSLLSVEDPIEQRTPWMAQTQVCVERGLTFASVIRSMMRQDPDAIMIGEIRDSETAQAAYKCALTGHKVVCSIHAGSISEIAHRFSSFGIDEENLTLVARLMVHQELVPALCPNCRYVSFSRSKQSGHASWKAKGCGSCNYEGTFGRIPLADVLYQPQQVTAFQSGNPWDTLESLSIDRFVSKRLTMVELRTDGFIEG